MYKTFFVFCCLLCCLHLQSQACLPNGIILRSQAEIDNFPATYPGCTTLGGELYIEEFFPGLITNLDSLQQLRAIGGNLVIYKNMLLANLHGLQNITAATGLFISENSSLATLDGLGSISTLKNGLGILRNPALTDLSALRGLTTLEYDLTIEQNDALPNLAGLDSLTYIGGRFYISDNKQLTSLQGLNHLHTVTGEFTTGYAPQFADLHGLESLSTLGSHLTLYGLKTNDLTGLEHLTQVGGYVSIGSNDKLKNLEGLNGLRSVGGGLYIGNHPNMTDLKGLSRLRSVGAELRVSTNAALQALSGLDSLVTVSGTLTIEKNDVLTALTGLGQLYDVGENINITDNPLLSDCAIFAVCDALKNVPDFVTIQNNAGGCDNPASAAAQCPGTPLVKAEVRIDTDGDCEAAAGDLPVEGIQLNMIDAAQNILRPTGAGGIAWFPYLGNGGAVSLSLPQFPTAHWGLCQNFVSIVPGSGPADTTTATLLLRPLDACPELTVNLALPAYFRECPATSELYVAVQNTGTLSAEGVKIALVMPSVFNLQASVPPVAAQSGDTLFFEMNDLPPLAAATLHLTVKTRCDTVLAAQSFCWEAFARPDNACPANPQPFSEIKISAQCFGDTLLRFTLKNIGNAPTQAPHEYTIIRNQTVKERQAFSLAAGESKTVELKPFGATYRMEATKSDDGTLTAASAEHCGGLTPAWVTAFWTDQGPAEYDAACRSVFSPIIPVFPNQKTAFPKGAGANAITPPNRPLTYTIDFENSSGHVTNRVRLRDFLPKELNVNTFRPLAASHPYTWEIAGDDVLEVTFDDLALPPAAGGRGFFSFSVEQKPDLPQGRVIANKAFVYLDKDPLIWTYAANTIGTLNDQVQPCTLGDLFLNSQMAVDYFFGNYPGCEVIDGSISIAGQDITNLNGLLGVTEIKGYLSIHDCPLLQNLKGLDNLASAGNFVMHSNHNMTDMRGLEQLSSVTGNFDIAYQNALQSFNGLNNLKTVGGLLSIRDFPALQKLDGLRNLEHVGGYLNLSNLPNLTELDGLNNLREVQDSVYVGENTKLAQLSGFQKLKSVGGSFWIQKNPSLSSLNELDSLQTVGGSFVLNENAGLTDLGGLGELTAVGNDFDITYNHTLESGNWLNKLQTVGGNLYITGNHALDTLGGLHHLSSIGRQFSMLDNQNLISIAAFDQLRTIGGGFEFYTQPVSELDGFNALESVGDFMRIRYSGASTLNGFKKLKSIAGQLWIWSNSNLLEINGFDSLAVVGGEVWIEDNWNMKHLGGFSNLSYIGGDLSIIGNPTDTMTAFGALDSIAYTLKLLSPVSDLKNFKNLSYVGSLLIQYSGLKNLKGLDNLKTAGGIALQNNYNLSSLSALENLEEVSGGISISDNPSLSDCAAYFLCKRLQLQPGSVFIFNNAPGCNSDQEVLAQCGGVLVEARVLADLSGGCSAGAAALPVADAFLRFDNSNQTVVRPSSADGSVRFGYFPSQQWPPYLVWIPGNLWSVCDQTTELIETQGPDTVRTTIVLHSPVPCPQLTTTLGLPTVFRGCLVQSELQVSTRNTGSNHAQGVKTAVVMPPVFELVAAQPPVSGQHGDTLFFDLGDLPPFASGSVLLTIKTRCDTFLFGHTLCWEAFSSAANNCPGGQPDAAEIRLSAQCLADTAVRFTLQNIGNQPTFSLYEYRIIRNAEGFKTGNFSLAAQESTTVEVPADGATWRMEATKRDDGSLTAVALENCGGLTPGQIIAFWLERGSAEYDFDCREVVGSFDPNQKTAVPVGTGEEHFIAPNRPLQYTIDFQNTGTDTAFRVLLRDVLPPYLDISTFRPGFASHPYTWEIRGMDTLEVLFFPIALPDSNVNEPASHGFFTFDIDQIPGLPDGTVFENTASIIFDFNPPIVTNTVRHTIGQLVVRADEPQRQPVLWQVLGNPTREAATFVAKEFIAGEKRFELSNAAGRLVRQAAFSDQSFEFRREILAGGLYFFRITDAEGRVFSGKIVVIE